MKKHPDYKKIAWQWLGVFFVGGIAGVLFSQVFLPQLAAWPFFNKIAWFGNLNDGTMIINKTEKIYLAQDAAYQEVINLVANSVVAVQVKKGSKVLNEGSGFILTSDGLVATADISLFKNASQILVWYDGQSSEAQILKQDPQNGLALLKIIGSNLPVITLGDLNNLRLGETVLLVGAGVENGQLVKFANLGWVKKITPSLSTASAVAPNLEFTFSESALASGSPMRMLKAKFWV